MTKLPKSDKVPTVSNTDLITRSQVEAGLEYPKYRNDLRYDFFFSCAYCTIGEAEALAINFTIDHYEPQRYRSDLTHEYNNLMYCCSACNRYKGSRMPTPEQRQKGLRFFRPDQDVYGDHFEKKDRTVKEANNSNVGRFTITTLDLNRQQLIRLRELRERLHKCEEFVLGGVMALRKFQLDQIPPSVRGRAASSIRGALAAGKQIANSIDALLRENTRSELIDDDPDLQKRAKERKVRLKQMDALEFGEWRKNA